MDPRQGGSSSSSRRTTATGGGNKQKEVMRLEQPTAAAPRYNYRLFPEEPGSNNGGLRLHELLSAEPQEVEPKVSTALQPRFPIHARQLQSYPFFPQGIHSSSSQTMDVQDNSIEETIGNAKNPESQISGTPGHSEQDLEEPMPLSEDATKRYEHLMAVHLAHLRVYSNPDISSPGRVQQTIQELKNQRARHALGAQYLENLVDTDTTAIQQQRAPSGSSQVQHYEASRYNNTTTCRQQQMVANTTFRLMDLKGQVEDSCATCSGSYSVQRAIDVATPEEIVMLYEEITPCVRTLACNVFGNYVVQKILEHGPQSCKRKLIRSLIEQALPLSFHTHGCRVIQKALEVGPTDQKVAIAKELSSNVLKCVRDQYANHVIQKCIECLPPKHALFIFRIFCRRARSLSTDPYASHVIQKVLDHCNNREIYDMLSAEIIEFSNKLSADQFGNYVVQHLLEHGGRATRSAMVNKFEGRVVSMSYNRHASNVIEKCLIFGSQEDRQLITNEIIGASGGHHVDHLLDMMINPNANLVIQKIILTAEEQKVGLLVSVARRNLAYLVRYPHGRHVITAIERFLSAKGSGESSVSGATSTTAAIVNWHLPAR